MSSEDPGLLGGLPRSRPGKRSPKRAPEPDPPRAMGPERPSAPPPEPGLPGLGTAIRIGELGLKVATGVVRRLPRPPRP
jgi:hypothetical protein